MVICMLVYMCCCTAGAIWNIDHGLMDPDLDWDMYLSAL
jgi:hypothetical protein